MKYLLSLAVALFLAASVEAAGNGFVRSANGVLVVNNNNNNNNNQARVQAQAFVRARRPVLRFLFPRAALRRDALFGRPVDRFGRVR